MKQKIFMKTLFILLFLSLTFFSCNSDDNSENSDRTTITINTTINGNNYSGLRVLIDGDEENSDTAYDNEYYEAETNNNGKVIFENVLNGKYLLVCEEHGDLFPNENQYIYEGIINISSTNNEFNVELTN